ncbi:MAG TPA: hypothetical protein VFE14_19655 [Micromonosporaceae bacterium]|jgi:hypothetical protein|nr:hypothetical protein [Micromonosporaceae bacterium]
MRRVRQLLVAVAAGLFAPLVWASSALAGVAPGPTSITIDGPGLTATRTLHADTDGDTFTGLLSEVSWLATRAGNAPTPDPPVLGPRYRLVIRVNEVPDQAYELYPLAIGGPRVFRPAEQPSKRKTAAAWFYGRVSMPDTLRAAGVPLLVAGSGNGAAGGQGGGGAVEPGMVKPTPPTTSIGEILAVWQRDMLLLAAGAVVLLGLIGGFARLVRRW